jgi:hypothetical protein
MNCGLFCMTSSTRSPFLTPQHCCSQPAMASVSRWKRLKLMTVS